jgi:uncharacterized protein YutE (UPF0331/DUF86 family)
MVDAEFIRGTRTLWLTRLPADLATSLVSLARFRNLLVHGYAAIDDDRIVEILAGEHLRDLARLRAELIDHITR